MILVPLCNGRRAMPWFWFSGRVKAVNHASAGGIILVIVAKCKQKKADTKKKHFSQTFSKGSL
jgi:hypothetical protein